MMISTDLGPAHISLPQWLLFRVRGRAFLGYRQGAHGMLDLWAYECSCGSVHVDYPRGWGRELRCSGPKEGRAS